MISPPLYFRNALNSEKKAHLGLNETMVESRLCLFVQVTFKERTLKAGKAATLYEIRPLREWAEFHYDYTYVSLFRKTRNLL
jgi:hypothetical protein